MFGKTDKESGETVYPKLELVRLAIPRRVYTSMHMQYTAEALEEIYSSKENIAGFQIDYAPEVLRHFTARLKPVE